MGCNNPLLTQSKVQRLDSHGCNYFGAEVHDLREVHDFLKLRFSTWFCILASDDILTKDTFESSPI